MPYLSNWFKRWFIAVIVCLLIIIGCGASILLHASRNGDASQSKYVINQVRLKVGNIMLFLEQYARDIVQDQGLQEELLAMCQAKGVSLIVAQLDGNVIFTSDFESPLHSLNLKTELHYDLYYSKVDKEMYKIAFPVIDDNSQVQTNNAIFTIPARMVFIEKEEKTPLVLIIIILLSLIVLFVLLFMLRNKIRHDTIEPIHKLKDYSEAILKGNYEQKAEYGRADEIGEVYAMFDQMRMEIRYLSIRRDQQERAQKELITNISHDLKTPLTAVKAYIDAIQAGICVDMDAVMDYVGIIQIHSDKMSRLVEDLLMHALRELGRISVEPVEQYSRKVFVDIINPIGHYVRTSGVTFIEPMDIPNVLINVDEHRLEQVISNLITNALKHTTDADTISIEIEQEQEYLKVKIADTGEGIRPQDMPFIFERYFKGPKNLDLGDNKQEGSGLGLSICKTIIEAHGGSISFKSSKEQGTVFYFTIPLC